MISVPEAWQLPRMPGNPVSLQNAAIKFGGNVGTV